MKNFKGITIGYFIIFFFSFFFSGAIYSNLIHYTSIKDNNIIYWTIFSVVTLLAIFLRYEIIKKTLELKKKKATSKNKEKI